MNILITWLHCLFVHPSSKPALPDAPKPLPLLPSLPILSPLLSLRSANAAESETSEANARKQRNDPTGSNAIRQYSNAGETTKTSFNTTTARNVTINMGSQLRNAYSTSSTSRRDSTSAQATHERLCPAPANTLLAASTTVASSPKRFAALASSAPMQRRTLPIFAALIRGKPLAGFPYHAMTTNDVQRIEPR